MTMNPTRHHQGDDRGDEIRGADRPLVMGEVCHASVCAAAPISQVTSPARRSSLNRWAGSG